MIEFALPEFVVTRCDGSVKEVLVREAVVAVSDEHVAESHDD